MLLVSKHSFAISLAVAVALGAAVLDAAADDAATTKDEDGSVPTRGTDSVHEVVHEVVVVTASRIEQNIDDAPAAMSIVDDKAIGELPADNFGDLLRRVPGLNVAKGSGWDTVISGRNATSVLARGQLVLVDNRSVFQDFNGTVWWSTIGVLPSEIRQIEVVRGPASAVWGANAADGVIHVITKSPREMVGTSLTFGGGERETFYTNVTHAGVEGKLAYRVSGGWYRQDPYDLPTGVVAGSIGPTNPGGTPFPVYDNTVTEIPKVNVRIEYDTNPETIWSVSGGFTGVGGSLLTPAGPSDWDKEAFDAFAKIDWSHRNTRISAYGNFFDNDGGHFFLVPIPGQVIKTRSYNLDVVDARKVGTRHQLTYGGNARLSTYDVTLAPTADDRRQFGVFLQDEVHLGDHLRWLVGARVDDIDPMGSAVSPRTSLLVRPLPGQTVRFSYSRAFLAPTILENFLDAPTANVITIDTQGGPLDLVFPLANNGDPGLDEERLDSFEIGWIGRFGEAVRASVNVYRNELKDAIESVPVGFYSSENPPPGWPLDPALLDVPPPDGFAGLPSRLSSVNIADVVNQGVEVSIDIDPLPDWSFFLSYSFQDIPEVDGIDPFPLPNGATHDPINTPPKHRVSAGAAWSGFRFFANADVSYQDDAFWTDVLDSRFWGPTEAFTLVNANVGVHLKGNRITASVSGHNAFNEEALQHLWGNDIGRTITAQVTFRL